jgi:cytochrome c553
MKKTIITLIALMTAAVAVAAGVPPAGRITIAGKRPVKFSHQTHTQKLGLGCGTCHHDEKGQPRDLAAIKGLADTTALACAACHTADFKDKKLRKRKYVFHGICRACHKKGYQGKHGPTRCVGCHGRKKRKPVEGC